MSLLQAIFLAIIEGITEFLPISSTGHLVLAATLLHIEQTDFVKSYEIIIQLGAILAVVVLYFRFFLKNLNLWRPILVAFFPSMVVGLVLYKIIKYVFLGNPYITLATLFLGGIAIIVLEKKYKKMRSHTKSPKEMTLRQAFLVGLCQSLSVVPGVSRAAATILGGMYAGLTREAAVEFSFFLAVPTMLAASTLDFIESSTRFQGGDITILSVGFLVSFIVALLAIRWLLTFVRSSSLVPFGLYRIALSIVYFLGVLI